MPSATVIRRTSAPSAGVVVDVFHRPGENGMDARRVALVPGFARRADPYHVVRRSAALPNGALNARHQITTVRPISRTPAPARTVATTRGC